MKLKYYSGAQVTSIIEKLPSKEYIEMLNAFAKESSADVVEVIRCKDCKWGSNLYRPDTYACDITNQFNGGNCFCSYGERRTDDDRNG